MGLQKILEKTLPSLAVAFLLFPFLIACNLDDNPAESLASVSISLSFGSKALMLDENESEIIMKYCISTQSDYPQNREQWPVLNSNTINNLKPGDYMIFIDGYVDGKLVLSGNRAVSLRQGRITDVTVVMEKTGLSDSGNLVVDFSSCCENVLLTVKKVNGDIVDSFTMNGTGSVQKKYQKTIRLECGIYEIQILSFSSGIKTGGQTLACCIEYGETVSVTGQLEQCVSVSEVYDITSEGHINLKIGEDQLFAYPSGLKNPLCVWYLDGTEVSRAPVYCFSSTTGGKHILKCYMKDMPDKTCEITSYYHEKLSITTWDVLSCLRDTDKVYCKITQGKKDLLVFNNYPLIAEYTTFDKLTDLAQIGAEAKEADMSKLKDDIYNQLVIGKNAPLSVSNGKGWMGQELEEESNYELFNVFCFKDIDSYAFYGCDGLMILWVGDSVKSIGAHAFGATYKNLQRDAVYQNINAMPQIDALAFSD